MRDSAMSVRVSSATVHMASSGISSLGAGLMRPNYEELPIDVPQNKLLDWLVDRKKTPQDWYRRCVAIAEKITELQATLGEDVPAKLGYGEVVQIVERLKTTDGATNIIGQYTSPRLLQWLAVQRAYEKENVYLGEGANQLLQYVQYDIPAAKRHIANWQQQLKDLARKDAEAVSSAAQFKARFTAQCHELKIQGVNIRNELAQLALELPTIYGTVERTLRSPEFSAALDYYGAFLDHTMPSWKSKGLLPRIFYLREHGNVAAVAYLGEDAAAAPKPAAEIVDNSVVDEHDAEPQIQWDVEVDTPTTTTTTGEPAKTDADGGDEPSINWDVDEAELASDEPAGSAPVVVESEPVAIVVEDAGSVAQQDTMLDRDTVRNKLIDDLLELRAFMQQRLSEQSGRMDALSLQQFQNAIHLQLTTEALRAHLAQVERALDLLRNPRTQQLFLLKSSPRFVGRLAESLEQKLRASESTLARLSANETKRAQISARIDETTQRIASMSAEARALKTKLEKAISKTFNNRVVNIMGDI